MLDRFGDIDVSTLSALRAERARLLEEQGHLGGDDAERIRRLDFAEFQINEIDRAGITSENEIEEVIERLQALTEIQEQAQGIHRVSSLLDSDGGMDQFVAAVSHLGVEGEVGLLRERILASVQAIREDAATLNSLVDPERINAEEIEELNRRVDTLRNLARKHGGTLMNVLQARREAEALVDQLRGAAERWAQLDGLLAECEESLRREASRIRHLREVAGTRFSGEVNANLPRVALPNARIETIVGGEDGAEVDLHFVPNPGSRGGPIQHIGSGGELSRILLAVSLVIGESGRVTVFDEVDSGIGGNVAQSIGQCLRDLAHEQQVIAVTHLASVAAQADHHFVVEKHVVGDVTHTAVRAVSGSERVSEIARMLAGDGASTESRALAERLLQR
jgi:DNA repair protein RecN (Recombination protein N)